MLRWVGPVLAAALATSGCAAFSNEPPQRHDGLEIVAAFYPLQYVAERVAGDHATVIGLTRPGAEPHDLELSVAQTAQVVDADVVVYEKGLQAAVDDAVGQTDATTVDAAAVAHLEPFADGSHEAGGLGDLDPHFWQDPTRLARVADAVAAALARADPAHAAAYADNDRSLDAELTRLDRDYAAGLRGCTRHTIVVSHDAFGYLGRYGLDVKAITGLSPDAEPTPADLARLQQLIRSDGITTVFGERLVSPAMAESLARDLGVRTAVLDPIEGLTDETRGETYLTLMRQNLAALREANACP